MSVVTAFNKFYEERVRSVAQGYEEVLTERVTQKEIIKAYNRWCVCVGAKQYGKMNKTEQEEFKRLCEERFGDSRGKEEYVYLRVFLDEEDVEEFDKEHQEKNKEKYDFTLYSILTSTNVPAEEAAAILAKKPDVEKQIVSIIKLSRVFAIKNTEDKGYIQQLEACIKRKEDYIEKLLNKIALLYLSLPEK